MNSKYQFVMKKYNNIQIILPNYQLPIYINTTFIPLRSLSLRAAKTAPLNQPSFV